MNRQLFSAFLASIVFAALLVIASPAQVLPTTPSRVPAPFTIAGIFKKPGLLGYLPENIEWSPDGGRITFLERHTGSDLADLYELDLGTGKRAVFISGKQLAGAAEPLRKLGNSREQERMARYGVATYHWSPKGDLILYTSGNQLYAYNVSSKRAHRLTATPGAKGDPKLSPDERYVSYTSGGNLYLAPVGNATRVGTPEAAQPRAVLAPQPGVLNGALDWVYPEELGLRTAYEWSPDSRRILFLQFDERPVHAFPLVNYIPHFGSVYMEKYPKAGDPNPIVRLGIYDLKTGAVNWVPVAGTPDSYLPRFGWMPSGKRAYATDLNRAQTLEHLFSVNPRSGHTRLLLTEQDPYWINVTDDLKFLKDGGFIWGSDRDGWHHLYRYDQHGKLLGQLTAGAWNVNKLEGVDEADHGVYFTADKDTPLQQNLYRVPLNVYSTGGQCACTRLTRLGFDHVITMAPKLKGEDAYIDRSSTAVLPPQWTVHDANGARRELLQARADISRYHLAAPTFFTIPSADGKTPLNAMLWRPLDFSPNKKYPVITYQYGGPQAQVVDDSWGAAGTLYDQILLRQGFLVFSVDNREAPSFDRKHQDIIKNHFGTMELADQLAGEKWLKAQPYVDPSRIGIWGWSFGGYMTTYEMTHAPGAWKTGIAVAPVTDWHDYDSIYTERYMGMPRENPQGYRESSSVAYARNLQGSLLILHGTEDDNVHFQNTIQFIEALIEAGKQFDLMLYPDKTHSIHGSAARTHLFTTMDRFWLSHLAPR